VAPYPTWVVPSACWVGTARYLEGRGQYQEAKPLAERALTLARNTSEVTTLRLANDMTGWAESCTGWVPTAAPSSSTNGALRIAEAHGDQQGLELGSRHSQLGSVLRQLGDLAGARTHQERALEITQATLGPDHSNMAAIRDNLDTVVRQLGGEEHEDTVR